MSLVTEETKAKATEIYCVDDIDREKSKFLLKEMNLRLRLLPLQEIEACGIVRGTGLA